MQASPEAADDISRARRKRRRRWVGRWVALGAALVLLLPNWPSAMTLQAVPALSPYVAIASAIAVRTITFITLLSLPVLGLAILRPRWFCRFACPTGLLTELAGRLRGRRAARARRLPAIGPWLVLLTLGGACVGYPLLLWLDPLAIFAGCVNGVARHADRAAWWGTVALPTLLVLGVLWPGVWCRQICPLGVTQDLLALGSGLLRHRRLLRLERAGWRMPRRTALGVALGAIGAQGVVREVIAARPRPLRPPGAAAENAFSGLCVRCGSCGRICPSGIVRPHLGRAVDALLTPTIHYDDAWCLETCVRCTQACPSGALRLLTLEEKPRAAIGLARVDMSVCLLGDDRECSVCRTHCPYDAIRIVFSEADYVSVPQVDPRRCNGCGACQVMCPTAPVKAIVVSAVESPGSVDIVETLLRRSQP